MASHKQLKDWLAMIESEGIGVLGVDTAKGSHRKVRCRLGHHEFYILVSMTPKDSDVRAVKNFRSKLRRICRAHAARDSELFEQLIRPK